MMHRILTIVIVVLLVAGFVGSAFASYNGVGLVTSGRTDNTVNSRGVFFIFPGGGPGFGK